MFRSKIMTLMAFLVIPALILSACSTPTPQIIKETVVVKETVPVEKTVKETVVVEKVATQVVEKEKVVEKLITPTPALSFTTPHPILGDIRVRRAIAYCSNRPEIIASVYGFLTPEQQQVLLMDTFIPKNNPFYKAPSAEYTYPFDPEKGKALLEEAGWKIPEGGTVRAKEGVGPLALKLTTTSAQFRITWTTVFAKQMAACGIQILPLYTPASWWFGSTSGLRRRDFELGAFAWVGEADPPGRSLYDCEQIPRPENNWEGQNYMGWCNDKATQAIRAGNNTLDREERIRQYGIVQEEFAKDMVSLPVFARLEASGANKNLKGFRPDPTEYYSANADQWELPGSDTVVIGFTQEPATMYDFAESAAVQRTASQLVRGNAFTQYSYDYQPDMLEKLPNLKDGDAKLNTVEVKAGDKVYDADGNVVELKAGVKVVDVDGKTVEYKDGTVKMPQLVVTFKYKAGLKWSDGEPVKKEDIELFWKIRCDKESGAVTYTICDFRQKVEAISDTEVVHTFTPGVLDPTYFLPSDQEGYPEFFPAHQKLSDGRLLKDVPAKEWATLPEIAEKPMGAGPFMIESWTKGQNMTLVANPNYYKPGLPKVKKIVIQFVADSNQAVAQLLTGDVDVVGKETVGAGTELETILKAAGEGKIQAVPEASPTWEHIDMNMFVR